MEQLSEVYGLSPEVVELLSQNFFVAPEFEPSKIPINSCTKEQLQSHPYINKATAELIINYRANHYPLTQQDLEKIPTISAEQLPKIARYLSFN